MKRISILQQKMINSDIDVVIYGPSANLQYLTEVNSLKWNRISDSNINGYHCSVSYPDYLLLVMQSNFYVFTNPDNAHYFKQFENANIIFFEQFEDILYEYVVNTNKVAVGCSCFNFIQSFVSNIDSTIEIVDGEDLTFAQRAIKDKNEIATLKKAAKFTDDAVASLLPLIRKGNVSQRALENQLMQYGLDHNLNNFSFEPTTGFTTANAENSKELILFDGNSMLVDKTTIAFDVGYVIDGYCSDWGRSLHYGQPSNLLLNGYKALQAGQQYMVSKIVPGKTKISEMYQFILDEVTRLGYQDYLRFKDTGSLGHQIGIDCHEYPMLNSKCDDILMPGMVFCSEPKMWFPDEAYLRVEDMILIEEDKAVFLSNFDRDLFVV